jgi:hypothetical protein
MRVVGFEILGKILVKTLAEIFAAFPPKSIPRTLLHSASTSLDDISTISKHGMEQTVFGKLHHGQSMAFESEMPFGSSTRRMFASSIDL